MRKEKESGQSMMEFALTLGFPLIIIVGAVIVGMWQFYVQNLENAVDEAARAIQVWNVNSVMYPSCKAAAEGGAAKMSSLDLVVTVDETVCPDTPQVIEAGTLMYVEVSFDFEPPFFSTFLNPPAPRTIHMARDAHPTHE